MPNGQAIHRFWWPRTPPKPPEVTFQEPYNTSSLSSTALLALSFLKESSDVFPPLKSAVAALLRMYVICDSAKGNKECAKELRNEVLQTIDCLSDLFVKDTLTEVLPIRHLRHDFETFFSSCENILDELAGIQQRRHFFSRIIHSKDDERVLTGANKCLTRARNVLQLALLKHQTKMLVENFRLQESTHGKLDRMDVCLRSTHAKVEYTQVTIRRTFTISVFLFGDLSP
ncbi:hypothetical protein BD410DRAFT_792486 [Rickenella mellea]|uniref:Fungal N-terminal domain-containing protein n=1 Tax=Rickenella mellea TaxID=50990 RepID=A0A4Y7PX00_9AGAM|nr:hypothetical protein BD410DRAFT_792486 [Rickenella mellea]